MENTTPILKTCRKCNESKELTIHNYYTVNYSKDGHMNTCIHCLRILSKVRWAGKKRGIYFPSLTIEKAKKVLKEYLFEKNIKDQERNKKETAILKLFYRTKLENVEKIIDNSDRYISEKLKIPINIVSYIICRHLDEKYLK